MKLVGRVLILNSCLIMITMPLSLRAASLEVVCAYYAPDRGTPYKWFEGAKEIQSFFTKDYRAAGFLYVYVRNASERPLHAREFYLDGTTCSALRKEHKVVWQRVLPNPIPPGGVGEVMIRLRSPLAKPVEVSVEFEEGASVKVAIPANPVPLRIETVGFNSNMDEVFLVVERLDSSPRKVAKVLLDGVDLAQQASVLDAAFTSGYCPISIKLQRPLTHGSYHVYSVATEDDLTVACCVRTYDGWVPLGSYGYGTYEEYARNGANGHNNFGRHSKSDLDSQANLGMRGVMITGDSPPADYMIGHPGLFAYCLHDEPDCADYYVKDIPHALRIGEHAMEMERRASVCRQTDPTKLTFLTIDLTYKPANYYIYGPIADVANPDCYPISLGADAAMVREVVETARYGVGPRPLSFTFQGCYEELKDHEALAKHRFPRPPFAEEERVMIYYALGAGARGLFNYIHCSEDGGRYRSRGSGEFPDVWREIGRCYREIEHVAPLVALAHPTALAQPNNKDAWARTLLCGEDNLLLVCVNDGYEQLAHAFRHRPIADLRLDIPSLPWFAPKGAWLVTEQGFEPVSIQTGAKGVSLRLPRLDVAALVLVSANPALDKTLSERYRRRQERVGLGILRDWRARQAKEAAQRGMIRKIAGEFPDCVVMGKSIHSYGIEKPDWFNPKNEKYNVFESGQNQAKDDIPRGAEWTVTIPDNRAGKEHIIYAICGFWGRGGIFTVTEEASGKEIVRREISGGWRGKLLGIPVTFPRAGVYKIKCLQPGKGPKGARTARAIYVAPTEGGAKAFP